MAGGSKKASQESGKKSAGSQKATVDRESEVVEWVSCQSCVGWFQADVTPGLIGKTEAELRKMEFVCPLCRMEKRFQLLLDEAQVERVRVEVELQQKVRKQQEEIGQLRAQLRDQSVKLSKVGSCSCAREVVDRGTDPECSGEHTQVTLGSSQTGDQRGRDSGESGRPARTYAAVVSQSPRSQTSRPTSTTDRAEKKLKVLLLGDSIPRECVKREIEAKAPAVDIDDRCVPGAGVQRVKDIVKVGKLTEKRYDLVILSVGTNDGPSGRRGKSGIEARRVAHEIEDVVMEFRDRGTKVRVLGVLPRGDRGRFGTRAYWLDAWGREVNAELARKAGPGCGRDRLAAFCGTERYFCTFRNGVPYVQEELFCADGVHLTARGKAQLATCVSDVIGPFL